MLFAIELRKSLVQTNRTNSSPKTRISVHKAPEDISPEEALARFRRLKEEDRARRQLQELKEISQRDENNVARTKKD